VQTSTALTPEHLKNLRKNPVIKKAPQLCQVFHTFPTSSADLPAFLATTIHLPS